MSIRIAQHSDFHGYVGLLQRCQFSPVVRPRGLAMSIWDSLISQDYVRVIVAEKDGALVSTCTLIVCPNILRNGRSHGFLENVGTDPNFQAMGYGSGVVDFALDLAWSKGCFHVLMQSGRKDPYVDGFYRDRGFVPDLRTGYAATNPATKYHDLESSKARK